MGFKNLNIKKCYETTSKKNELLETFYIPVLNESTRYFRIAGYFSSTALMVASRGIEGLVNNNGTMRLLISPEVSEHDYEILKLNQDGNLSESLDIFKDFDLSKFDDSDNLRLLAWLLANEKLEIKIVVNKNSQKSIFHQKVGIFFDDVGDAISFSGSVNETAKGWLENIEEFKTFRSWEIIENEYFNNDLTKFNQYWHNEKKELADVYDLPESIKKKIIAKKPNDIYDIAIMKKFSQQRHNNIKSLSLFKHQIDAINAWKNNNYSILMEMATGTGKTRAAIGCFCELLKEDRKILIIISTPQNTLSRQWKDDIERLGINVDRNIIIDGSNSSWKRDLELTLIDINLDRINNAIIYTTHTTSSKKDFTNIVEKLKLNNLEILFICDEVHAIGSDKQREALLSCYDFRIGLSATPDRMFDSEGTAVIKEFFENKIFEFTIRDALNTINPLTGKPFLNTFYYYPRYVFLNEEEDASYKFYSRQIAAAKTKFEKEETKEAKLELQRLLMCRANIVKSAENKLPELDLIIDELQDELGRIKDTIIFVSNEQIKPAIDILSKKYISRSKITESESSRKLVSDSKTERQKIIADFKRGDVRVLLGIKCLDEGIDIPNARIAIIMASSVNPREYVQRVGRVIRQAPNKEPSIIYDLIVLPENLDLISDQNLLNKEARRALLIAQNAINYKDVKQSFEMKGAKIECL